MAGSFCLTLVAVLTLSRYSVPAHSEGQMRSGPSSGNLSDLWSAPRSTREPQEVVHVTKWTPIKQFTSMDANMVLEDLDDLGKALLAPPLPEPAFRTTPRPVIRPHAAPRARDPPPGSSLVLQQHSRNLQENSPEITKSAKGSDDPDLKSLARDELTLSVKEKVKVNPVNLQLDQLDPELELLLSGNLFDLMQQQQLQEGPRSPPTDPADEEVNRVIKKHNSLSSGSRSAKGPELFPGAAAAVRAGDPGEGTGALVVRKSLNRAEVARNDGFPGLAAASATPLGLGDGILVATGSSGGPYLTLVSSFKPPLPTDYLSVTTTISPVHIIGGPGPDHRPGVDLPGDVLVQPVVTRHRRPFLIASTPRVPEDYFFRDYFPAPSILELLEEQGRAKAFAGLLRRTNLTRMLEEGPTGPFTLFVPTDAAFARLEQQGLLQPLLLRDLPEQERLLKSVLLYHVVPGRFMSRNFDNDITVATAASLGQDLPDDGPRRDLRMTVDRWNRVVAVNGKEVLIRQSDQVCSNGVVHYLDEVVYPMPPGSVLDLLRLDGRFSILADLARAAGIDRVLLDTGADSPMTLFAPVNEAFLELPRKTLEEIAGNRRKVSNLILKHLVAGTQLSPDLTSRDFATKFGSLGEGHHLIKVRVRRGQVLVGDGGGRIVDGDLMATNGAVQAINKVLLS